MYARGKCKVEILATIFLVASITIYDANIYVFTNILQVLGRDISFLCDVFYRFFNNLCLGGGGHCLVATFKLLIDYKQFTGRK